MTPPELLTGHDRDKGVRSLTQSASLADVDTDVWTYSEFNRRTLLDVECPRRPPLPRADRDSCSGSSRRDPPDRRCRPAHRRSSRTGQGCARARRGGGNAPTPRPRNIHVTIAGNLALSDERYVTDVRDSISNSDLDDTIELKDDPSPLELAELYARAHFVVSPSFHEGLCIPVIEGYLVGM